MGSEWLDDLIGEDAISNEDPLGAFYCPYTNTSECALLIKGWQPQELCEALECEQVKLVRQRPRRRPKAA